MKARMMKIP